MKGNLVHSVIGLEVFGIHQQVDTRIGAFQYSYWQKFFYILLNLCILSFPALRP
jgi:hypothetical protein